MVDNPKPKTFKERLLEANRLRHKFDGFEVNRDEVKYLGPKGYGGYTDGLVVLKTNVVYLLKDFEVLA